MEPRRDSCVAAERGQPAVGGDKCFLCRVARLILAREHTEAESEYLSLPSPDYFAEGIWVAIDREFDDLFIGQIDH